MLPRLNHSGLPIIQFIGLTFLISISLSGCSSLLPKSTQINDVALDAWQVRGKLSITGPEDSVTGYLSWVQNKDTYNIYIAGPFGRGATQLSGNRKSASILLPGMQQPIVARSAESLMLRYAGWSFPVSHTRYWIMGMASPDFSAQASYNELGQLESLEQLGWSIRFSRYQKFGDRSVPGLIKLTRPQYRVTFSIKDWDFSRQQALTTSFNGKAR